MRKLARATVPAPPCLAKYHPGTHSWKDVRSDKPEIQRHLEQMQGKRCAYCEGDLEILSDHIEHFRRKSKFPHLTFTWNNLYWSCDQSDSCGHYKDHGAGPYDPNDLIEPAVHDPDRFFRFRSNGTIEVRPGLCENEEKRAKETLRVFNLQPEFGRLRNMRKAAAAGYLADVEAFAAMTLDDRREYVRTELQEIANLPFSTVIRHMFDGVP